MNHKLNRLAVIGLALAVALTAVGAVSAAPGSAYTGGTDTSDEVYIADGKEMDGQFNASGDTTWNLSLESVPQNADVAMNVSHSGNEYYSYTGTFSEFNDGDPDSDTTTSGKYHAFTDDELAAVPMAINENVTMNVTYWNASAENPTPTTLSVDVQNTEERSVARLDESAAFADVETIEPSALKFYAEDYSVATVDDTRDIAGSNTTVIYTVPSNNVTDAFENATGDYSSSGAFTLMQAGAEGDDSETIPVFYNGVPDWYDSSDMGSYAVYDADSDMVEYHLASDNFDGQSQADLTLDTESYGITDAYTVFNVAGGMSGDGFSALADMVM